MRPYHMQFTSKHQNNTRNGFPILKKPYKVVSFMVVLPLVLRYDGVLLRKTAILDLPNMAATAGAQIGPSRNWRVMVISTPGPKLGL